MNLLAEIATDPSLSLGVQTVGASVLIYLIKKIGRIERDVAVIKDRLKVPEAGGEE